MVARFARQLKSVREERRLSQHELAKAAGIHWSYLSRLERGQSAPGIDLVDRLATALATSIPELLPSEIIDPTEMLKVRAASELDSIFKLASPADLKVLVSLLALLKRDVSRRHGEVRRTTGRH